MHHSTCCILYRLQNRSGHWPFERKPPPTMARPSQPTHPPTLQRVMLDGRFYALNHIAAWQPTF